MAQVFEDIDDASAQLILRLQLEDSARITFEEDMQRNESVLRDRQVAAAVAEAFDVGEDPLRPQLFDEPEIEKVNIGDILALYNAPPPPPPAPPLPRFPCTICQDNFVAQGLTTLQCGDRYCFDCLVQTFTRSFVDEELYPPRCCRQPIALATLGARLTPDIITTFNEKGVEFGTTDRVYCSSRGCETFLSPDTFITEQAARCPTCQATTCTMWKGASHQGSCPEDEDANRLLVLAEEEGWKRCPGCHRMVELTTGCFHMSCICGAQFCYNCGVHPWKSCPCPQWDQDRLYERANEVVQARNRANGVEGPAAMADLIGIADHLHANHNCVHTLTRCLRGEHECAMCPYISTLFIFRCAHCDMLLCRWCLQNRVRA